MSHLRLDVTCQGISISNSCKNGYRNLYLQKLCYFQNFFLVKVLITLQYTNDDILIAQACSLFFRGTAVQVQLTH